MPLAGKDLGNGWYQSGNFLARMNGNTLETLDLREFRESALKEVDAILASEDKWTAWKRVEALLKANEPPSSWPMVNIDKLS